MKHTRVLLTEYFASPSRSSDRARRSKGGEVERLRKRSRPSVTLGSHASAARRSCLTANILFQWAPSSCTKFYESYRSTKKNPRRRRRRWRSIWRQYRNATVKKNRSPGAGFLQRNLGVNGLDGITVNLYSQCLRRKWCWYI